MWMLAWLSLVVAQEAPGFSNENSEVVEQGAYRIDTVATGVELPWSIAFLPGGDMLVTEREGRLRIIRDGLLLPGAVDGVPPVFAKSQAGLFEVVLHPNFSSNGLLYLTYAHGTKDRNTLRLARGRYRPTATGGLLEEVDVLFEADAWRSTAIHYGARMAFLPDGTLLLTSGDGGAFRHQAQKLDSHFGKVLRLNDDGTVPADNPFVGQEGARPEIWSYGHRNPQGIAVAPDGSVYENEHGARGGDEVNVIEPGLNYGWPLATYGVDYSGAQISPYSAAPGTAQPLFYWTPSIAPGGIDYVEGTLFENLRGRLISAGLASRDVRVADPLSPANAQLRLLSRGNMRIRHAVEGPDGGLYILVESEDNGGRILRLSPA